MLQYPDKKIISSNYAADFQCSQHLSGYPLLIPQTFLE